MNTLRTFVMLAILGAVGFGVYATLNRRPPPDPPEGLPEGWAENPAVQFGEEASPQLLEGMPGPPGAPTFGEAAPPPSQPMHSAPAYVPPPSPMAESAGEAPAFTPPPVTESPPVAAMPVPTSPAPADLAGSSLAPPNPLPGASLEAPLASAPLAPPDPNSFAPPVDPNLAAPSPAAGAPPDGAAPPVEAPPFAPAPPESNAPPAAAMAPPANPVAQTANPTHDVTGATLPADPTAAAGAAPLVDSAAADFATSWTAVQQALAQDRLIDAHRELSRWHGKTELSPQEQQVVQQLLDQLAGTVIYSRESLLEPPYEVQPGDNLEKIATAYSVPWQLLGKINGISDPQALHPGEKLKVVRGPFSAVVSLHTFRMTVWLNDLYAGSFPIGIGSDATNTPEGMFDVQQKLENPTYYGPDHVVDANDPSNPLGERWISLGNHLGIHGTIDPASIGKAESRGCIRLTERDVNDVYDMLAPGSKVTIRR